MTGTVLRLWTVDEYHRMIEAGVLSSSDRVELLNGLIIKMSPQLPPHASTTQRTARYLDRLFDRQAYVRMQLPVSLRPQSEPEPDVAVVRIDPHEYADHHPTPDEVFLLIEVADTTLERDRLQKAPLYAKAGILEYWILDVNNHQVYVFRASDGAAYTQEMILSQDEQIVILAFPTITVSFSHLFS